MALTDVALIARVILDTACSIQRLGEVWYQASAAWADYPRTLNELSQKYDDLISALSTLGMLHETTDANLTERLRTAASSLQTEEARLRRLQVRNARCNGCFAKLSLVAFPNRVRLGIQSASEALDSIPRMLKMREENVALLKRTIMSRPFSFPISHDGLYVHLEVTESAVYKALEDSTKHNVVLLHGGTGRGKSTLARHTAFHYKEEHRIGSARAPNSHNRRIWTFDHVFYLECGPKADFMAKQLELLQLLGFQELTTQGEDVIATANTAVGNVSIRRQLAALLWEQVVLIILDDVWETEFIQNFVELFGRKVKCLVTSQNARLWSKALPIEIEVGMPDAKRILASHAGFPNNVIPVNLQAIVDRIVAETEGHPLALASLATAISKKRCTDVHEWKEAEKSLLTLLHAEDTAPILNQKYPRSFWSSMKLSIQSISAEAQQLLILASICAGPSIPEEAMSILCRHKNMHGVATCFSKLRNDLEDRSLLAIKSQPLIWDDVGSEATQRTWSLHRLQKQFIREEMREDIEMLVASFLNEELKAETDNNVVVPEDIVVTLLCALYFDSPLAKRAARKLGVNFGHFTELRRHAIEPIIWLLANSSNEDWSETSALVARKVLFEYVCDDQVKDSDITHLLVLPFSTRATCWALRTMTKISEKPLVPEGGQGMMKALVGLLGEGVDSTIREKALRVVVYHAVHEEHRTFMVQFPGLLESLVNLVTKSSERNVSSTAKTPAENSKNIQEEQKLAAWALAILSLDDPNKRKIADFPNALAGLVELLLKRESPETQWRAAGALANLSEDHHNMRKIATMPHAIEGLVELLWKHDMPQLQEDAARALANLSYDDENMTVLADFPYAVSGFVELICSSGNPEVQKEAARAFANLSCDDRNKGYLAEFPFALEGLVRLLTGQDCPEVQSHVARALANLCLVDENREQIFKFPNALAGVVKLLYKQNAPDVQSQAARALANLSLEDENKRKMVEFPGALAGLVQLLLLNHSPTVRQQAAWALANLADDDFNRRKIGDFPNAIARLAQLLFEPDINSLQVEAARALLNLSEDDQNRKKIAQFPNLISRLFQVIASMSSDMQDTAAQQLEKLFLELKIPL
ncbi:hypothetical protein Mapa_000187 [Marchantia paleacea]|nr:hypothetical protein Mapa_000187 [Marchantia paleacea]